ncbi:MAG: hypothetical protein GY856_10720 [bacterium]|nr:hypothetical protein [bacterium]
MGLLSKFNPTIRASLILALAVIVFLGGSYFLFVQKKTRYFTERNLRHLSSIGRQVESSVRSHERVLRTFADAGSEELFESALETDLVSAKLLEAQQKLALREAAAAKTPGSPAGVRQSAAAPDRGTDESRREVERANAKLLQIEALQQRLEAERLAVEQRSLEVSLAAEEDLESRRAERIRWAKLDVERLAAAMRAQEIEISRLEIAERLDPLPEREREIQTAEQRRGLLEAERTQAERLVKEYEAEALGAARLRESDKSEKRKLDHELRQAKRQAEQLSVEFLQDRPEGEDELPQNLPAMPQQGLEQIQAIQVEVSRLVAEAAVAGELPAVSPAGPRDGELGEIEQLKAALELLSAKRELELLEAEQKLEQLAVEPSRPSARDEFVPRPETAGPADAELTEKLPAAAAVALEKKWTKLVPLFEEVSVTRCRWSDLVDGLGPGDPPPFPLRPGDALSLLDGPWLHILVAGEPISKLPDDGDGETGIRICARIRLDRLLRPVFEQDVFDALVLARTNGEVVYQNAGPELVVTRLDHLPGTARGSEAPTSFAAFSRTTQVLDVTLSGSDYKLFLQPQPIPSLLTTGAVQAQETEGWVVAGLVGRHRFRTASLRISPTLMVALSAALLLLLFSYPFLKLWLLGPRQRLRILDALMIAICALLGLAVATVFLFDVVTYGAVKHRAGRQIQDLADEIEDRVEREVSCGYRQLELLEKPAVEVYRYLVDGASDAGQGRCRARTRKCTNLLSDEQLFPAGEADTSPYPFLSQLFLIDDDGEQLIKWNVDAAVTPRVSLDQRAYVRELRGAGGGWRPGPGFGRDECRAAGNEPYYLESIISWTDGTRQAVLSKRLGTAALAGNVPNGASRPEIVAMSLPMLSLIDPVLPRGFGFAVINDEGTVLFHSESLRNLNENLFTESGDDRALRSAVVARGWALVDLRYGGRDRHVFVRPMASLPWTMVTFFDKKVLRLANVETLFVTAVFLVLYGGVFLVLALGILLFRPGYRAPWLWPQAGKVHAYLGLSVFLSLLGALLAIAILFLDVMQLAIVGVLLPALALDVSYLALSWDRRHRPQWTIVAAAGIALAGAAVIALWRLPEDAGINFWSALFLKIAFLVLVWAALRRLRQRRDDDGNARTSRIPLAMAHSSAVFCLLVIVAVLPAAAFFKAAHAVGVETVLKHGQLHLARALEERGQRIRERYCDEVGEGKSGLLARREALVEPLDVHHAFLFGTRMELRREPAELPRPGAETPAELCGRGRDGDRDWRRRVMHRILDAILPHYSQQAAEMRELLQDDVSDADWRWQLDAKRHRLVLEKCRFGDGRVLRIETELPSFPLRTLVLVISGAALVLFGTGLLWIARFVARRILLVDLVSPRWIGEDGKLSPQAIGPFLLVCERPSDHVDEERFFVLDTVTDLESGQWRAELAERTRAHPLERVLVKGLDRRLDEPALTRLKLALLEELTGDLNRTVAVVSGSDPATIKAACVGASSEETSELRRRCVEALAGFAVLDLTWKRRQEEAAFETAEPRSVGRPALFADLHLPRWGDRRRWLSPEAFRRRLFDRSSAGARALERECSPDPFLAELGDELRGFVAETPQGLDPLTPEQLLEEVGERAEDYYRGLWETCSPDEKLALGHIAEEGLVNAKNHRAVRRLLARGLVRRTPHPVVMNESFRRYLLSDGCRQEVRELEIDPGSAWSRLRWPLILVLLGSLVFVAVTQQEFLDTTVALLTGAAAAIPALLRLFGFFGPSARGGEP